MNLKAFQPPLILEHLALPIPQLKALLPVEHNLGQAPLRAVQPIVQHNLPQVLELRILQIAPLLAEQIAQHNRLLIAAQARPHHLEPQAQNQAGLRNQRGNQRKMAHPLELEIRHPAERNNHKMLQMALVVAV